jgi:hypothetical protein
MATAFESCPCERYRELYVNNVNETISCSHRKSQTTTVRVPTRSRCTTATGRGRRCTKSPWLPCRTCWGVTRPAGRRDCLVTGSASGSSASTSRAGRACAWASRASSGLTGSVVLRHVHIMPEIVDVNHESCYSLVLFKKSVYVYGIYSAW